MNNMAVCNYIVGVLGAVIGGLIMQAASTFPLAFTENGPGPPGSGVRKSYSMQLKYHP